MKRKYVKPSMTVYQLNQTSKLLVGSGGGEFGYAPTLPGITENDDKHLA